MILVDNFKIILLVGLICAVGMPSTDAAVTMCKRGELATIAADAETNECGGITDGKCKVSSTEMEGCVPAADCTSSTNTYCCDDKDECNDFNVEEIRTKICNASYLIPACARYHKERVGNTASGMFKNSYEGFPIVMLVSASTILLHVTQLLYLTYCVSRSEF